MKFRMAVIIIVITFIFGAFATASALTIDLIYFGGTSMGNTVGGGNLPDIVRAAADQWEQAIIDDFTLTLHYGYANISSFGSHSLVSQSGGRETVGIIRFDTDFLFTVFMDSTPYDSEEYQSYRERSTDFGAGPINDGRRFGDQLQYLPSFGVETFDLFSAALHEVGHALGLSQANTSFITEAADGYINITSGIYAGSALPLSENIYGYSGHFEYGSVWAAMGDILRNERNLLSDIDILAVSQVSGFSAFGMTPVSQVPEPTTILLLGLGLIGLCLWAFRRKFKK